MNLLYTLCEILYKIKKNCYGVFCKAAKKYIYSILFTKWDSAAQVKLLLQVPHLMPQELATTNALKA